MMAKREYEKLERTCLLGRFGILGFIDKVKNLGSYRDFDKPSFTPFLGLSLPIQ